MFIRKLVSSLCLGLFSASSQHARAAHSSASESGLDQRTLKMCQDFAEQLLVSSLQPHCQLSNCQFVLNSHLSSYCINRKMITQAEANEVFICPKMGEIMNPGKCFPLPCKECQHLSCIQLVLREDPISAKKLIRTC